MTRTKYQQLQPEERMRIEIWRAENVSQRGMARRLGRAPSTLMRELRRNATACGGYGAMTARARRAQRRQASRPAPKLAADSVLWGMVRHFLDQKWSPQEISATLKRAFS
jgi:IS30 family transposase